MRDADTRRQERVAASSVSETDYLRRVLGRLLTANTSDRTSRARKRYHGAFIARY